MVTFELEKIQSLIQKTGFDGWLLYDFRGSNNIALKILQILNDKISSRRYYHFIPSTGLPVKIVNAIEAENPDYLPSDKIIYVSYNSLLECLNKVLKNSKNIAMEYSPDNAIPYVSKVDADTVELIRSIGVEVKSSADIISYFTSVWSDNQFEENKPVAKALTDMVHNSFQYIHKKYQMDLH